MKIKALVPFSNGTLSMEQYQVAEVTDTLGNQLIAAGVAIEIGGGGTGGGVVHAVVSGSTATLDKTWQEIFDGEYTVIAIQTANNSKSFIMIAQVSNEGSYYVTADGEQITFYADSASGYPSATME